MVGRDPNIACPCHQEIPRSPVNFNNIASVACHCEFHPLLCCKEVLVAYFAMVNLRKTSPTVSVLCMGLHNL